jgi:hypothetical protein
MLTFVNECAWMHGSTSASVAVVTQLVTQPPGRRTSSWSHPFQRVSFEQHTELVAVPGPPLASPPFRTVSLANPLAVSRPDLPLEVLPRVRLLPVFRHGCALAFHNARPVSGRGTIRIMLSARAHDPQFMLRAALIGFDGARQRFLAQATPGAAPQDVFVPLSEALWWAVSADDGFEDLARSGRGYRPNVGNYREARGKDQFGRVLRGLRYARDRCGHQRALIAVEDGLRLPFVLPAVLGELFRWRPSDQLPPPDPRFRSEGLRPDHDSLLSGRPASEALESAAKWFTQEQNSAGL